MAEEKALAVTEDSPSAGEEVKEKPKKGGGGGGKKRLIMILVPVLLVAAGGGYFAYSKFFAGKQEGAAGRSAGGKEAKTHLLSMDSFVVNLSEPGRYLKVSMQLELADPAAEPLITDKMPILRDAVITLISSQSYEFASSPEGKLQLKEEVLIRLNNVIGREVFRNLYFTDFVMQ